MKLSSLSDSDAVNRAVLDDPLLQITECGLPVFLVFHKAKQAICMYSSAVMACKTVYAAPRATFVDLPPCQRCFHSQLIVNLLCGIKV